MIGIFFVIDNTIIVDAVPMAEAEEYGDALQYGGHYEFWESLVPKSKSDKKLKARAYDAYPRGRVVFFNTKKEFNIYADACITEKQIALIKTNFGLENADIKIDKSDKHYKCAGCNPRYMD